MTLAEALQALGVSADANAATLKRAYLKLIRVHSPERDPQGFMRLREAFERAQTHAKLSRPTTDAAPPAPCAEPQVLAPEVPQPSAALDNPFERELQELSDEPDPARREERARQLLAAGAGVEVYWAWLASLESAEPAQARVQVLRQGIAQGFLELLPVLRRAHPLQLTQQEIADWERDIERASVGDALALARCKLMRAHDAASAAAVAKRALESVPTRSLPLYPHLHAATDVVLGLLQAGELDAARDTHAALQVALEDDSAFESDIPARATCELLLICDQLHPRLVAALAKSLATRGSLEAESELADVRLARKRDWRTAARAMQDHAPLLTSMYVESEKLPAGPRDPSSWKQLAAIILRFAVAAALYSGIHAVRCHTDRPDHVALHCKPDASRLCTAIDVWNDVSGCVQALEAAGRVQREYDRLIQHRAPRAPELTAVLSVEKATRALCHPGSKDQP